MNSRMQPCAWHARSRAPFSPSSVAIAFWAIAASAISSFGAPAGHTVLPAGPSPFQVRRSAGETSAAAELIRRSADLLHIDMIGRTDRYYTAVYLRELEVHSPYRFSFLNEQRNSFYRRHGSLVKLMETMMLFQ